MNINWKKLLEKTAPKHYFYNLVKPLQKPERSDWKKDIRKSERRDFARRSANREVSNA